MGEEQDVSSKEARPTGKVDDASKKEHSLRNLRRFTAYAFRYWPWLATGFVAGLVRMILPLYLPRFLQHVLDDSLTPFVSREIPAARALAIFWESIPFLLMLMGLHALATVGRFYLPNVAANSAIRDIRHQLFRHLQRLSLAFHTQRPTGATVARIMQDVAAAQRAVALALIQTSQHVLRATVIGGYLLYRDCTWALVSFATMPLFIVTTRLLQRPMRRATRRQRESIARMSGRVHERLAMIREVQSFTAEPHEERHILSEVNVLRRHTLRQQLLSSVLAVASELTRVSGLVIVLGFGVYRVLYHGATIGDAVAFYLYAGMLLQPIQALTSLYANLHMAAESADRVFEFFDSLPAIRDQAVARPLAVKCPDVRYENVRFAYPADQPVIVLNDISFTVPGGSRVALVGESGCGKSTLLSLLPRFYDVHAGRILIAGQDIREVGVRSLRRSIGIVPQEPVLFAGTVRENILYGRRDATEEAIREAARDANAEDFILGLRNGYDTIVGERGVGLSGGQIQRVAIARAFLKDPAILILDEATSNLDATSEALVLDALDHLAQGRTTFIIAHRLSTIRAAHIIFALKAGSIVEQGSHEDLLARDGEYAGLWKQQMGKGTIAQP